MKITYLGQAGLMFETHGKIILIDPYLSDSVAKIEPQNYRRQPINERFLKVKPDVIVITHNHADHLDKETLVNYLTEESKVLSLAPLSAWKELRKFGGAKNNYVMFNDGTTWTEDSIVFRAVKAEHSDEFSIGVIITAENKNYYITGDTLYKEKVFKSLPDIKFEAVFLPVNGKGNNMNIADALRFSERIKVRYIIPVHFGMFDDISIDSVCRGNILKPSIYSEIDLNNYCVK